MGRLGGGIALIVVGAILTFAWRADIPGVADYALGLILMLAGAVLVVLHFVHNGQVRRSPTVVERRTPVVEDRGEVIEEHPVTERRRRRNY
jgi:hypothetical protein